MGWNGTPGRHGSAVGRRSRKTRKGNGHQRWALAQMIPAFARIKNNDLSVQFHRLAQRRGKNKAGMAVGRPILVIAYHLIKRKEPYRDLGGNYFDQLNREVIVKRLQNPLEKLGYQVVPTAQTFQHSLNQSNFQPSTDHRGKGFLAQNMIRVKMLAPAEAIGEVEH
jgi:beta-galactosidase/beta-glucuronidase